jgi:hypothetical protein
MKNWNWKLTRKLIWWTALVGLGFWLHPAHAQEFVTGKGIICDEAAQVARVITATDTDAMLVAVNGEKANTCGIRCCVEIGVSGRRGRHGRTRRRSISPI